MIVVIEIHPPPSAGSEQHRGRSPRPPEDTAVGNRAPMPRCSGQPDNAIDLARSTGHPPVTKDCPRHIDICHGIVPHACFQRRRRLPVFLVYSGPLGCFSCESALAINLASSHLEWVGQDEDCQQMDEMLPVRRGRCGFAVTSRSRAASAADFWPSCPRVSHPRTRAGAGRRQPAAH